MVIKHQIVQGLYLYYSLYSAPCRTVLLTMKALNLQLPPGGMRKLDIHEKCEHTQSWFEKINYEKVVPTLVDNGFIIWESRVIAKYLVQKYATAEKKNLYPSNMVQQARVDRLLHFDLGVLYKSISDYFKPQAVYNDTPDPILGAEIEHSLQLLEKIVSQKPYALAGVGGQNHLTIADFSFLSSLSLLESMDYSYDRFTGIKEYVEFLKYKLDFYNDCFHDGINHMKNWSRSNLKYLPKYLGLPNIPYDDNRRLFITPEVRI